MHYAKCAEEAGLDGVVCSPLEAGKVHDICGKKFLTITPGVRFADGDVGDQKRVMTPAAAKEIGYPVLVRPSFVLGGRAMQIVADENQLRHYLKTAVEIEYKICYNH